LWNVVCCTTEPSGSVRRRSGWNCWPKRATTPPFSACCRRTRTGRPMTRTRSASSPTSTPSCCDTRPPRQRVPAAVRRRQSAPVVYARRRPRIRCPSLPSPPRACWCTISSSRRQAQWPAECRPVHLPSIRQSLDEPTRREYKLSSRTMTEPRWQLQWNGKRWTERLEKNDRTGPCFVICMCS